MPISEKLTDIKFTKSVAGYSSKEVDGFINDLLPLVKEQEQLLMALKVKLEAFEAQRDEIQGKEQDAYRLLEAAKKEAEIIVATAKSEAQTIKKEADVASEVQLRAATARAAEIISDAETKAAATVSDAQKNADKIIRAADAAARATIEKVKAYAAEEKRKAQELSNECADFEKRFKALVADTAAAFAAVKESAPLPPKEKAVKAEPKAKPVKEEPVKEEPKADGQTAVDFEIVGGIPYAQMQKKEPSQKWHLYDTVQVTYDDSDDFSDIRDIMKRTEKRKSPTHFSE